MCLCSEDCAHDLLTDSSGVMPIDADGRTPYEIIEEEVRAYREDLPEVDADGWEDVEAVASEIHDRLFDLNLKVTDVYRECGCHNHNISSRFRKFLGRSPKGYVVHHRLELAKQLLQYEGLTISAVAFAVGYDTVSAFSQMFKERVGQTPSDFRS